MLILLALAILTVSYTGCSRCRNLFRRGSPCGGTALAAPAMLGGAIPLGNPVGLQQAPQIMPQGIISQPAAPMYCEPCPTECVPCDSGYFGGGSGYYGGTSGDCGCQTGPGEYFGDYLEGSAPPSMYKGTVMPEGSVLPQGSGAYDPKPKN